MKKNKPRIEPAPEEEIGLKAVRQLSHAERAELRAVLAMPVMRKVWENARCAKPTEFLPSKDVATEQGLTLAAIRLAEMRGFEAFASAVILQAFDPKPPQQKPQDNYPDAGLPESDFIKQPNP